MTAVKSCRFSSRAQVSGASQLVQLTQARVHLRSLRAGRTLELDDPSFDLGQGVRRLLEVALASVELFGFQPTFDLEPTQIAEQRSLARGQRSSLPLQRLDAFIRAARQGFELGAFLDELPVVKVQRDTETGDAPGWQGATRENTGCI